MREPGPAPIVTIDEAVRSQAKRRERDLQLAAWCGLGPDEVEPFLRRLELFDARTRAIEARQAADAERAALAEAASLAEARRRFQRGAVT